MSGLDKGGGLVITFKENKRTASCLDLVLLIANPLQTLSQGLVLTLRSLLALSLTIKIGNFKQGVCTFQKYYPPLLLYLILTFKKTNQFFKMLLMDSPVSTRHFRNVEGWQDAITKTNKLVFCRCFVVILEHHHSATKRLDRPEKPWYIM